MKRPVQTSADTHPHGYTYLTISLSIVGLILAFLSIQHHSFFGDEGFHLTQINLFREGKFVMDGSITNIPGYHAVLASLSTLTGWSSLTFFRVVNLLFSFLSTIIFLLAMHKASPPGTAAARTLQYVFLPILFPFFVLLYTDALSVLLILSAVVLMMDRNYIVAIIAAGLAILVRQNNVVWLAFCVLGILLQEGPILLKALRSRSKKRVYPSTSAWIALATALLFFGFFAFFVKWNGGIAIGDKTAHPFPAIHTGNVFFYLLLSFFLFLPYHLRKLPLLLGYVRKYPWLMLLCFFVLLALYELTFVNTHPYNQDANSVFMRNRILVRMATENVYHWAVFPPIAFAAFSLACARFKYKLGYWILPFTILFLLPSWLVEQRYYFIPLMLFILLRKDEPEDKEFLFAFYGILCTLALFIPVATRQFFL
jgi:alpha-1,2-glucosyltransferase